MAKVTEIAPNDEPQGSSDEEQSSDYGEDSDDEESEESHDESVDGEVQLDFKVCGSTTLDCPSATILELQSCSRLEIN